MIKFYDGIESAKKILYDNANSGLSATDVQSAIDELKSLLDSLDVGGAASDITYDNTTSGLTATNVQSAIDELDNRVDSLESTSGIVTAADVSYDNSASGLSATNVQDAIDNLYDNEKDLDSRVNNLENKTIYSSDVRHRYTTVYNAIEDLYSKYSSLASSSISFTQNYSSTSGSDNVSLTVYGNSSYTAALCVAHAANHEGGNVTISINSSNSATGNPSAMSLYATNSSNNIYASASGGGTLYLQLGVFRLKV